MPARDASKKLRLAEYGQAFVTLHNFGQQAVSAVGSGKLMAYLYNEQDEISSRDKVLSITHNLMLLIVGDRNHFVLGGYLVLLIVHKPH